MRYHEICNSGRLHAPPFQKLFLATTLVLFSSTADAGTSCHCLLAPIQNLGYGHLYLAASHLDCCGAPNDCESPIIVYVVAPPYLAPEDCEIEGDCQGDTSGPSAMGDEASGAQQVSTSDALPRPLPSNASPMSKSTYPNDKGFRALFPENDVVEKSQTDFTFTKPGGDRIVHVRAFVVELTVDFEKSNDRTYLIASGCEIEDADTSDNVKISNLRKISAHSHIYQFTHNSVLYTVLTCE